MNPTYKVTLSCINDAGIGVVTQVHLIDEVDGAYRSLAQSFVDKMKDYMLDHDCRSWVSVDYYDGRDDDHDIITAEAKADCILHEITKGKPYDGWTG